MLRTAFLLTFSVLVMSEYRTFELVGIQYSARIKDVENCLCVVIALIPCEFVILKLLLLAVHFAFNSLLEIHINHMMLLYEESTRYLEQ